MRFGISRLWRDRGYSADLNFRQTILAAVGWSFAIKASVQIVTWAMTLIVIRILSPDDYGLLAVSQIFVNFMIGFGALGIGDALVQDKDTPPIVVSRLFGVLLMSGTILTIVTALMAWPISAWYHDPRLVPLIQVSGLGFLFTALTSVPRAFLTKYLRIRPMFIMELASGLVGAVTVISLAFAGYGVWALMLGWVATNAVKLLGFILMASEYFVWPRFGFVGVRPLFSFGIYRTFEYLVWMIATSADVFIISRWVGATEVGIYVVASNFATMPLSKIAPIINATAFPAFALARDRRSDVRNYLLKAVRVMATIAVPVFFGLAVTAPEIVDLVFGPNWIAAKPVLSILALAVTFRAILLVLPNFLQGIGDSKASFWTNCIATAIFVPAFIVGCQWGVVGVAWAWLLGYPFVYVASALIASWRGSVDVKTLLLAPLQPILAGVIMLLAVVITRRLLPPLPEIVSFGILVGVGAVTYGGVLLVLFRSLVNEVRHIFRRRA